MTRKNGTAAGPKRRLAVWIVVLAMVFSLGVGTMAVMADEEPASADPAAGSTIETTNPVEDGTAAEGSGDATDESGETGDGAAADLTEPEDADSETEEGATEAAGEDGTTVEQEPAAEEPLLAAPAEDPAKAEKPGTVTTQDQRKDGITLTLFDYDLGNDPNSGDTWNNSPTSDLVGGWPMGGINAVTNLKFFGHGGEPTLEGGNSNLYTGDYIARQGIVQPMLNSDGYPVMTEHGQQDLSALFSPESSAYKTVYNDVYGLFQKDGAGNYTYDSDQNYAYFDKEENKFKVYADTYPVYETSQTGTPGPEKVNVGFFPFDDYDKTKDNVGPALDTENAYNHQHGLTMEGKFTLPEDRTADGQDIEFHFSGDDDAWLFVDDVLVLDIGGLHRPVGGSVNFTTGKVSVDAAVDMVPWNGNAPNPQTIGTSNTLDAIFQAAGKEWDPTKEHSYKFFYLERGGCYSNLALETNLWKVAGVKVDVEKVWSDADEVDHSADSVEVQLMKKVGEGEPEPVEGKTLTLSKDNDWKDSFTNLPAEEDGKKIEYSVEETPIPGYKATYEKGGKAPRDDTYWVPADPSALKNGEKYIITAPNWNNGNIPVALTADGNSLITKPATVTEKTIVDKEGTSYSRILEEPLPEQQFVATENPGQGTWYLSNNGKNITLRGQGGYGGSYNYLMTNQDGWNQGEGANYTGQMTISPEGEGNGATALLISIMPWDNGWGGYWYFWSRMNLQNGETPNVVKPDQPASWYGHFTFWKQVEVESEIDLPDYWKITNTPKGNGDLWITKDLPVKEDSNPVKFVFSVKATFKGETVYDDIVTLNFDKAGKQTAKIEGKIPADAEVEVKEIYSGAAYSIQGDDTVTVTVLSKDDKSAPATVSFENTYNDGELTGGYGVLNTYTMGSDAKWIVNGEEQEDKD